MNVINADRQKERVRPEQTEGEEERRTQTVRAGLRRETNGELWKVMDCGSPVV